jgi:hypothetical protein
MANKWIIHIKKTMKTMKNRGTYKKGMGLKQVIKEAKKSWHKVKGKRGGGEDSSSEEEEAAVEKTEEMKEPELGGRRRRKHGKTQRRRKH